MDEGFGMKYYSKLIEIVIEELLNFGFEFIEIPRRA